MRRLIFWIGGIAMLVLLGCTSPERHVIPSFYHWKSNFHLSQPEKELLTQTGTQRIYLRFFDVDWSPDRQQVIPVSRLRINDSPPAGTDIVPTIYITNRSILNTPAKEIDSLAGQIEKLLFSLHEPTGWPLREVQIDCDWSSRSRERYFALLSRLRESVHERGAQLSVTIRLHQLKYQQKTGVPPADLGLLMYYNMGNLDDPDEVNSILDLAEGAQYLQDFQGYPLHLDVALPIFSWGVVNRRGKPVLLLNGLHASEAEAEPGLEKIGPKRFKVAESRYFRGEYLYKGDLIRTESVSDEALRSAAETLAKTLRDDSLHVAFYHLDSLTISRYDLETFAAVWDAFR